MCSSPSPAPTHPQRHLGPQKFWHHQTSRCVPLPHPIPVLTTPHSWHRGCRTSCPAGCTSSFWSLCVPGNRPCVPAPSPHPHLSQVDSQEVCHSQVHTSGPQPLPDPEPAWPKEPHPNQAKRKRLAMRQQGQITPKITTGWEASSRR